MSWFRSAFEKIEDVEYRVTEIGGYTVGTILVGDAVRNLVNGHYFTSAVEGFFGIGAGLYSYAKTKDRRDGYGTLRQRRELREENEEILDRVDKLVKEANENMDKINEKPNL